jgi:hypothetical protein
LARSTKIMVSEAKLVHLPRRSPTSRKPMFAVSRPCSGVPRDIEYTAPSHHSCFTSSSRRASSSAR